MDEKKKNPKKEKNDEQSAKKPKKTIKPKDDSKKKSDSEKEKPINSEPEGYHDEYYENDDMSDNVDYDSYPHNDDEQEREKEDGQSASEAGEITPSRDYDAGDEPSNKKGKRKKRAPKQDTEKKDKKSDLQEDESQKDEAKGKDPEKKMPFLDHLEELRWTILKSLIAVVIGAIGSYIFSKQIVEFLRRPGPEGLKLIFLGPTEGFMIYIKVSIFAGLILALPFVFYQFWKFIVPGLLEKEKKIVPPIVLFTTFCFLTGAAFAYFVIIPFGLKFLLSFQTDFLEATITIGKYLGFVVTLILIFGVVFELPVLAYFLTKIGILTPEFLSSKRRYGIVIIFIMAAVLTPPDIFTQLMLAVPLIILYEISIWISRLVKRKEKQTEAESEN